MNKSKWGRVVIIIDGTTTYIYKHKEFNAADTDTDWVAIRKTVDSGRTDFTFRNGCLDNYDSEWS
jgi:hypothetical protein